ncbi:MAG: PAS domain S-box protein [Shewanella sp.]|nr:PAS domain S-box protein [Shewanella sp.]MCF1429790.1 PAS domain S-box protein [Shewanella sp.]MCF1456609.1 PAS domain S-box protein [Shewanella sp.]
MNSFKAKLIALLLVAMLPTVYLYFQYSEHKGTIKTHLLEELQGKAMLLASVVSNMVVEHYVDVQSLGIHVNGQHYPNPLSANDAQGLTYYFNNLITLYQDYHRILLLSPDGRLLVANDKGPDGSTIDELRVDALQVSTSPWFLAAKDLRQYGSQTQVVIGGPSMNPLGYGQEQVERHFDILFAVPIMDDRGNLSAVLVTLMDFRVVEQTLRELLSNMAAPGSTGDNLLILSSEGTVLLDTGAKGRDTQVGRNWFDKPALASVFRGSTNGAAQVQLPGLQEPKMLGFASTGKNKLGLGWILVTVRPSSAESLFAVAYYRQVMFSLLAIVLFMLLANVLVGRRLLRSMKQLSSTARSLSELDNLPEQSLPVEEADAAIRDGMEALEGLRQQLIQQNNLVTQNSLQRFELLLKDAAIEAATTGIVVADAQQDDLPIIYANKAFYRTTGYSEKEVLGRNCRFLQGDDRDQPAIKRLKDALAKGEGVDVILRNYRKNGEMFWNRLYISPVRNEQGTLTHFVGIETDVTTLKAYEKKVRELNLYLEKRVQSRTLELQQAESQLRATFDTMTDALVVVNANGIIQQANRTTTAIFGYKAEELIGLDLAILLFKIGNIGDVEQWFSGLLVGTTKKMGALAETSGINKMGKVFPIELSVAGMRIANQREYTVVMRDISERKANEVRLRTACNEAEQANRIKSEFLGNMSHELRTPMNAVIGMTDLVLDSELTREQRHHLTIVSKSAHSLLSLLNEILDLTKLERGSMEIERLTFELRQTVQSAISMVELQARKKGLGMSIEMASTVAKLVVGDSARLRQVLINLVGNAVKFTEEGEVKLSVMNADGRDDYLHFVVEDTGIGIEAERIEQIFKPFVQSDGSISRRYGGTGLGTTISRQLVEKMGGEIWVESELGKGSKFHFTLWLPQASEQEVVDYQAQCQVVNYQVKRPLKILLAEDVAVNAELVQTRLGREGHQITWAEDGVQAVKAYESEQGRFDLVFMDIHMPNMNGFQAADAIRNYNQMNGITTPIIALTASGMGQDMEKCRQAGMDGFVIKPVDFTLLRAEMSRVLPDDFEQTDSPAQITEISGKDNNPAELSPLENLRQFIDVEGALENWGDEALYTKMVRQFPSQWNSFCRDVAELVHRRQWEQVHGLVHKLRGVSGGLRMTSVFQAAQDLESAIKEQEQEAKILGLNSELDDHLSSLLQAIETMPIGNVRQMAKEIAAQTFTLDELLEKMLALREMLERGMPDDEQLDLVLKGLKSQAVDSDVAALAESVDDFDFEGAIGIIDRIAGELSGIADEEHG